MRLTKYKCDRCGKEIEKSFSVIDTKKSSVLDVQYLLFSDYDFCKECSKEAQDLYNDFKKKINTWMKIRSK